VYRERLHLREKEGGRDSERKKEREGGREEGGREKESAR